MEYIYWKFVDQRGNLLNGRNYCQVESRDVLGNIKGTFGFVDADGEIKRVSYSSSNGTGFKATTVSPLQEHVSVVQSIPRLNRTTTTKKPNIVYPSSTEASTKSSVVQSIPRNRKTTTTTSTTTTTTTTTTEQPRTIFSHYLKGTGKSRPRFIINGQQRPLIIEEESAEDEDSQINRPTTDDKTSTYRKIIFAKRPVDQTLRPISDDFIEKEDETKVASGNNLRRQLHEDTTKPSPIVEGSNDDHSDVYGGSLSTTRPLFTTSTPPRVLQRVSPAGRVEKPKVYVNRENLAPARSFENVNSRAFEAETKTVPEERVPPQPILIRGPPRVAENREYLRQSTEPIFVRQQPEQFLREVPGGRILVPAQQNIEEDPAYRPLSVNRILLRPLPGQQPLYSTTTDANIHYLTENPLPEQEEDPRVAMAPGYMRPRPFPRPVIFQEPRPRPVLRPVSPPVTPVDDREYQTTSEYPYRSSTLALPPEPPNPINPPLSRRDFQLLLRRLLVSQYGVQALSYPKTYLEDALYDQQPYPSYQPGYQTVAPRAEIGYDQQVPLQYGDRVPVRRPTVYTSRSTLSPVYQPQQYEDYNDGRYSKRVYRQKFYAQEIGDEGDEILPAPIREALLLRMLQLAINAERPSTMVTSPVMTTTTPASRYRKTGPVRSVQIITDEEEDGKETMKKKMWEILCW